MKRDVGRGLEGSRVQELVSLWRWGVHPPSTRMRSPAWKISERRRHNLEFLWQFYHVGMID